MSETAINLRDYHVSRWRKLAEQRLDHLTELFVTGRWRRYFAERDFLEVLRQSKEAVAAWRRIEQPPASEAPPPLHQPARPSLSPAPQQAKIQDWSSPVEPPAPNLSLEQKFDRADRFAAAAVAELRPALHLPSPFEVDGAALLRQRIGGR